MGAAIIIFLVFMVLATVGVNAVLRGWVRDQSRREAHFDDPRTHTVAFGIPAGVDPTVIESALMRAGLECEVGMVGTVECVRIECDESQREQVRLVLESLHLHGYDGSELDTRHVVFEDER